MIFAEIENRGNMIIVDGYSNRKSVKTALKDLGRYIRDHIDFGEGQNILDYPEEVVTSVEDKENGAYFLEAETVPCASKWNEDTEEMEYEEANYYVVCRFFK